MAFTQLDALRATQVDELLVLYRDLWWAHDRSRADIEVMLAHSLVIAFEDGDGALAAFARVVTDQVYKALILDVVVAPQHRGTGLGGRLLDAVVAHPVLAAVRHLELYCAADLVPFYERWGFTVTPAAVHAMRLDRDAPRT